MIKKAVIPAAGWGTRFLPITKSVPKEMLPIIDRPALSYIVEEAVQSGVEEILLVISENKTSIGGYFESNAELEKFLIDKNKLDDLKLVQECSKGVKMSYVIQHEQLGLGHAVLQAKSFVGNETFAVLLGDDVYVSKIKPALRQLIDAYELKGASIVGTQNVPDSETKRYGICIPSENQDGSNVIKLKGVVEKPQGKAPSNSAISGRYILTPRIFELLETQERGAGGEIQLTDSILKLMNDEEVYSLDMEGKRYDIGSKVGYIEAIIDFALDRPDLSEEVSALLKSKVNK
ncbi:UTP--glucose-1-phosphate uridylyltransferase [Acholeplasma hippikon]|uniref:UTP--glucose-1-phosphate uridylyltransferase n=1 Tax=Acholeplasma hippikon TaxID=264636 RepID=A0A449BJA9_9MOLU|nr:UTP--glucose-1-phosphate uridylyltransferase [Acholeplasma hippikon]VEU82528.1 UTP-glucose-1-phosphate uridylyltransferase [Acholeplasma hippikon]